MKEKVVRKILSARVYDVAEITPLTPAMQLTSHLNNNIFLKREDLQPIFSFKVRGAYNKISGLTEKQKAKGIIAASAGNHAQGVALAAQKLGIKATIVMPQTTPNIKVRSVKAMGAKVVLHGDAYDQAYTHAQSLIEKNDYTFIHPYDDIDVIAGQGTVGMELLQQKNDIDAVFIPVGGGGLLAGMSSYIKYLNPKIKIIAVEAYDSACFAAAWKAKKRVTLSRVGIFADGVAVAQIGKNTWDIARHCVDDVVTATTDEMCAAIQDVFEETRSIMEPAGALSVAGMKNYLEKKRWQGKNCVAVTSGANLNFSRLGYIAERTELGEKREAVFAVTIDEKPGSFLTFCKAIGKRSITEFNYRFSHGDGEATANVFVGISCDDSSKKMLFSTLKKKDYKILDLSDNETAKLHVRYMVGGHPPEQSSNELVFRFIFPERPGALLEFLMTLGKRWNISMFHYRNHGSAFGRVLVGFHAQQNDRYAIVSALDELGYSFVDETQNEAYKMFLK